MIVKCKICNCDTVNDGTKLCDACLELNAQFDFLVGRNKQAAMQWAKDKMIPLRYVPEDEQSAAASNAARCLSCEKWNPSMHGCMLDKNTARDYCSDFAQG